jgi:transcriptional regulator with XRE-family HTH domain
MTVEDVVLARRLARDGNARRIREASGLSASEVARALGVSPGTVCRWERGLRVPRGEVAGEWVALLKRVMTP